MVDKVSLQGILPPAGTTPAPAPPAERPTPAKGRSSFEAVFAEELARGGLKFSAHAEKRLASRAIPFSPEEMANLASAVDRAAAKGARETLVLVGNTAFLVSVRNRIVITAIDGESLKENVFTNIDSAVIA
ncbi:MAG: TIGR02530 family flagellar biosynthesis protein [Bacillota bacterium]|nr:TIGR02530 family flagellar biosynthesis protein [Bacillota bacterium]